MSKEIEKQFPEVNSMKPVATEKQMWESKTIIVFAVALVTWLLAYFNVLPEDAIKQLRELDWTSPTVPILSALAIIFRAVSWQKIINIFGKK